MTVPHEALTAAHPQTFKAGNLALRPLSLDAAIILGDMGVDFAARVPDRLLFNAAFFLAAKPGEDYGKFLRRARVGLRELSRAVEDCLDEAFATFIRPEAAKGATRHLTPHGLGWPLELAEFLCAEYAWGWREALDTPVATAWALVAAARQRRGGRHAGLDYCERRYRDDLKTGRARGLMAFDS